MPKKEISRQTFLSLLTYSYVILFHSASLLSAAACMVTVWILQMISYALLPAVTGKIAPARIPFAAVLLAVIIPFACYRVIGYLPFTGFSVSSVLFPDPSVFLIMVPLLADQAQHTKEYRISVMAANSAVFSGLILAVSFLRELFGYGTLAGSRLFAEASAPFPMLRSASGAAFLLFFLLLTALFLYRAVTRTELVLRYTGSTEPVSQLPVLDREMASLRIRTALMAIPVPVISLSVLYILRTFLFSESISFDLVYLTSAVVTVLAAFLLSLLLGRTDSNPYRFGFAWLIPAQIMITILPYFIFFSRLEKNRDAYTEISVMSGCLIFVWFLAVWLMLFLNTMKRKLLFGNRPEILAGLPLILLITGLCLMVMNGFASIPSAFFTNGI